MGPSHEIQLLRFLGGLTVVAAVLIALQGVFAVFQAIDDLTGAPSPYSAERVELDGSALDLVGARGDELTFYVVGTSAKGFWAAPEGLQLDLASDDTGFTTSTEAVPPKAKDWEDPVFVSPRYTRTSPDFEVRGSFTAPDVPGLETQTLTGTLRGTFLAPTAEHEEMNFSTSARDLSIPATLAVVSAEEGERISSDFRGVRWRRIGLGVLFALVGLWYPISFGIWRDGEQTRRWEPYLTLASAIAVCACFASLWLKPFGA